MEHKVDVPLVLRAYQTVVENGQREGERYHWGGLTAESDFDGYTASLSDGHVTVRVLFHSRVDVDAPSAGALEDFLRAVERTVSG